MNYCTKCESFYQKPGTCNCFAGTQPAITITPQPSTPTHPWPSYTPWVYPTITWGSGTISSSGTMLAGTTSVGAVAAQSSCNLTNCGGGCGICS